LSPSFRFSTDQIIINAGGGAATEEDVLFIHGFVSSSGFWTETVLPHVSPSARSRRRLFAVDLLGFGRSPKPADSLYTLREHVEMIERSVLQRFRLGSFHVVAHSLGSVLALALAVKYPAAVKSLTLLAPVRALPARTWLLLLQPLDLHVPVSQQHARTHQLHPRRPH